MPLSHQSVYYCAHDCHTDTASTVAATVSEPVLCHYCDVDSYLPPQATYSRNHCYCLTPTVLNYTCTVIQLAACLSSSATVLLVTVSANYSNECLVPTLHCSSRDIPLFRADGNLLDQKIDGKKKRKKTKKERRKKEKKKKE